RPGGPGDRRSAQPGAASPLNSWTSGAPGHHRLSLPPWEARGPDSANDGHPPAATLGGAVMEDIYPRCCGRDVHKLEVVACLVAPGPGGQPQRQVRSFGTMTEDLLALSDWLTAAGCTHVAMESTGVYWKPIFNLLEGSFELLLVNARHVKAVPG